MPSQEDIEAQLRLLATNRRTLVLYLNQRDMTGSAYALPAVINGIHETRENIRHIKATLHGWNVNFEDFPDDEDANISTSILSRARQTSQNVLISRKPFLEQLRNRFTKQNPILFAKIRNTQHQNRYPRLLIAAICLVLVAAAMFILKSLIASPISSVNIASQTMSVTAPALLEDSSISLVNVSVSPTTLSTSIAFGSIPTETLPNPTTQPIIAISPTQTRKPTSTQSDLPISYSRIATVASASKDIYHIPANFLAFSESGRMIDGLPLHGGKIIYFNEVKSFDIEKGATYGSVITATINLLNGKTLVEPVEIGSLLGPTEIDAIDLNINVIKHVEFEKSDQTIPVQMALVIPTDGAPIQVPVGCLRLSYQGGFGSWYLGDSLHLTNGLNPPLRNIHSFERASDGSLSITLLDQTVITGTLDSSIWGSDLVGPTALGPLSLETSKLTRVEFPITVALKNGHYLIKHEGGAGQHGIAADRFAREIGAF